MNEAYQVKTVGVQNSSRRIRVAVPGSKSITNRALLLAAMAEGTSEIRGCLTGDDALYFLECLKTLGFKVKESEKDTAGNINVTVSGCGGVIPKKSAAIYVGSAGTAARFLVAMLAFSDGEYAVDASEQMRNRPMEPLIASLRAAGAEVVCTGEEGHFPLRIKGCGADVQSSLRVNIDESSQFLSALLIAAGARRKEMLIEVSGSHGLAYVDMTVEMMGQFGVPVSRESRDGKLYYRLSGGEGYLGMRYEVEPDMSAAAYFYGMAAFLGVSTTVQGVSARMLQGDTRFLEILQQTGAKIEQGEGITVSGPVEGRLKGGFTVDMSACSDQALTLAALSPYADAPITITGIGHIRRQECDRIRAICENLGRLGIAVEEKEDGVVIHPGKPHGAELETYEDHRVAMAFALTGLRTEGVVIKNPDCCRKTFPAYFTVLENAISQL